MKFIKSGGTLIPKIYYALLTNLGSKKKVDKMNEKNLKKVKSGEIKLTILLHGMFSNYHKSMYQTIKLLKKYGVNVISLGYEYHDPIDKSAKKIKRKIKRLIKVSGVKKIDIIGLCLGGAVARYYVEELGGKKYVDNLVTVYSPVRPISSEEFGFKLNKFLGGKPGVCNLGLLKMENKCSVKNHLFIYSVDDKIILPKNSILKGANQKKLTGTHLLLSYSPNILKSIVKFLKKHKK